MTMRILAVYSELSLSINTVTGYCILEYVGSDKTVRMHRMICTAYFVIMLEDIVSIGLAHYERQRL